MGSEVPNRFRGRVILTPKPEGGEGEFNKVEIPREKMIRGRMGEIEDKLGGQIPPGERDRLVEELDLIKRQLGIGSSNKGKSIVS